MRFHELYYYFFLPRCPSLPDLPSTCSLTPDPKDSCCQVASCTPPKDLLPDLVTMTPDPKHPNAIVTMLVPSVKGETTKTRGLC